jgi:2'-5' RNA ligase
VETAVLLCVPEAEPLVGPWRQKAVPSAAKGVPAHVTLLYPFLPAARVDVGVLAELEWFFRGVDAFELMFDGVGEFPDEGVVHLSPSDRALVDLTQALAVRWPECPPYAGKHDELVPHLTAVHTDDAQLRAQAAAALREGLPLQAVAAQAALWECDEHGMWSEKATFDFGLHE